MKRLAILLMLVSSPALADDMQWIGQSYDDGASLQYGIPDSGAVDMTFACEKGSDQLDFTYAFEPANAKVGMKLDVTLSAGGKSLTIATTGERLEMDDLFVLGGRVKMDEKLAGILFAKGKMTVKAGSESDTYPLAGSKKAAAQLIKVCRR